MKAYSKILRIGKYKIFVRNRYSYVFSDKWDLIRIGFVNESYYSFTIKISLIGFELIIIRYFKEDDL